MRKSFGKIRHIEKVNKIIENRFIESKKILSVDYNTNYFPLITEANEPSTEFEIKSFQDWMDINHPFWLKDPSGKFKNLRKGTRNEPNRHINGQGYGMFGPFTKKAWNLYGTKYIESKNKKTPKIVKGFPYDKLSSNPTPQFIAYIIKSSYGGLLSNDKESWAEAAFNAIKSKKEYAIVKKYLGKDPYNFIKSFMDTKQIYDSGPKIYDKYLSLFSKPLNVKKPKNVKDFQNWVLYVKKDNVILGKFGADGKWGKNTENAWNKYGSEYLKQNPEDANPKSGTIVSDTTNINFVKLIDDKKLNPARSVDIFNAGQEECAQFVNDFSDSIGWVGNAWTAHDNEDLGQLVFSSFTNLNEKNREEAIKYWQEINKNGGGKENGPYLEEIKSFVNKLVPSTSPIKLQLGDVVGIFYPDSVHHEEAFYQAGEDYFTKKYLVAGEYEPGSDIKSGKGWGMNTHVGIVGAIKNGTPIIFHNIKGQVWGDPPNNLHNGGRIAWVRRPGSNPIALNKLKNLKPEDSV